jgi:hypothetical protein
VEISAYVHTLYDDASVIAVLPRNMLNHTLCV